MEEKEILSVKDVFKEIDERERRHPIRTWCYRKYWYLVRLPGHIKDYIRDFFQRGRRGWAVSDTWSFYLYLAHVISGGLKDMKNNHWGIPTDILEKHVGYQRQCEEWENILQEMIDGFEAVKKMDDYTELSKEKYIEYENKMKRALYLFSKYYLYLLD